eukprot:CAMPEP_0197438970 /NCGR_PEP_ID=MMETSP1175-20131217/5821_1 /TAXON_ID=1003142 /ORGANISM="Triceratium dubium, Strain CCMP147" /LENGTH=46 /DNA_ID= /DNA_START= /DNA_END= /DNA_ORIENTATION=
MPHPQHAAKGIGAAVGGGVHHGSSAPPPASAGDFSVVISASGRADM